MNAAAITSAAPAVRQELIRALAERAVEPWLPYVLPHSFCPTRSALLSRLALLARTGQWPFALRRPTQAGTAG